MNIESETNSALFRIVCITVWMNVLFDNNMLICSFFFGRPRNLFRSYWFGLIFDIAFDRPNAEYEGTNNEECYLFENGLHEHYFIVFNIWI